MSHGSGVLRLLAAAAVLVAALSIFLTACDTGADPFPGTAAGRPASEFPVSSSGAATTTGPAGLQGTTETNGFFRPIRYTAVDGDTWEGIAAHFRMTPEILKSFNEPASVAAGQVIDLRGADVPQLGARGSITGQDAQGQLLYRASAGDTPAGIASRFGVPLYALRIANLNLLTGGEWIPPAGTTVAIPNPPNG